MTREEALKIVRENYPHFGTTEPWLDLEKALATLIPELAESEDERIRKIITDSVFYQYSAGVEYKDVLDYLDKLEKQKEQRPISFYGHYNPDDYEVVVEGNATSLKKKEQKPWKVGANAYFTPEQKPASTEDMPYITYEHFYKREPAEWSEEDEKKIRSEEYTKGFNDAAFGGKLKEWSVEDEDRIRQIERIAQQAGCTQKLQEEIHDWLKSLRKQAKQEWSEEDEKVVKSIINYLSDDGTQAILAKEIDEWIAWLKSLRPSWKPSEEQMEALKTQ